MKISYRTYNLPFKYPFTISKGTKTHQEILVVELDYFGIKAYGEAPAISYYNLPVAKMIEDIERKRAFLEKFSFSDPERYWHYLHHLFPANSFLVCALDMAGWDLYGKLNRKPLYKALDLDIDNAPQTDYTIGIDSVENMVSKIKENPWPVYKIKVGVPGDVEMVAELRKHTASVFRVDANAGWSVSEALEKMNQLKQLNVEFIEQPIDKDDWEGMKKLFDEAVLPLIADESCVAESDVLKCPGHFHGINIKLTKCGGITPARRMIDKARELNLRVMLGCMNESSIGTAAIAHLSPLVDFVDMDGPLLLAKDTTQNPAFSGGRYNFNELPGLGIQIARDEQA